MWTWEEAIQLFYLADKYDVKFLSVSTSQFLNNHVQEDNCLQVGMAAEDCQNWILVSKVIKIIFKADPKKLQANENWTMIVSGWAYPWLVKGMIKYCFLHKVDNGRMEILLSIIKEKEAVIKNLESENNILKSGYENYKREERNRRAERRRQRFESLCKMVGSASLRLCKMVSSASLYLLVMSGPLMLSIFSCFRRNVKV